MEKNLKEADSALLVMDIQTFILARMGDSKDLINALKEAIGKARAAGIPVIYVGVAFRKGLPEISTNNKSFSAIRNNAAQLAVMEEPVAIHPSVAPLPGDIVVTKRRISAFTGSDLEVVLRALHIGRLVLTGIATGGVVLSTLREAADKDYRLTVLSDGCADTDPEVHSLLLSKVFPRQADVITVEEWGATLNS
jgi:nicotinamidase-related amidase